MMACVWKQQKSANLSLHFATLKSLSSMKELLDLDLLHQQVSFSIPILKELRNWLNGPDAYVKDIDLRLVPSGHIKLAIEMKVPDMLQRRKDDKEFVFFKFNATIQEVLIRDKLCYSACRKCHRKVDFENKRIYCDYCAAHQDGFTYRYVFKLLLQFENDLPKEEATACEDSVGEVPMTKETGKKHVEEGESQSFKANENDGDDTVPNVVDDEESYKGNTIEVKLFEAGRFF